MPRNSDTISDLKVALIVTGNEFYNCSLLRKWSNRQIFNCRNPKITNKLIQDIEIRAVVETKLKQVNATIKPIKGNYQNNFQQNKSMLKVYHTAVLFEKSLASGISTFLSLNTFTYRIVITSQHVSVEWIPYN